MVAVSAQGAASELKPKPRLISFVYIVQDAGDSPGKILAVCASLKRARREQMKVGTPKYTTVLRHAVLL